MQIKKQLAESGTTLPKLSDNAKKNIAAIPSLYDKEGDTTRTMSMRFALAGGMFAVFLLVGWQVATGGPLRKMQQGAERVRMWSHPQEGNQETENVEVPSETTDLVTPEESLAPVPVEDQEKKGGARDDTVRRRKDQDRHKQYRHKKDHKKQNKHRMKHESKSLRNNRSNSHRGSRF